MQLRRFLFLLFACALAPPLFSQSGPVTAQLTASATTCTPGPATTACLFLPISSRTGTVVATIGTVTFSGTVQFEASGDGTTWSSVAATPSSGGSSVTSATGSGTWQIQAGGYLYVRIRCSTYASGTIVTTLNPGGVTSVSGSSSGGGGAQISGTPSQHQIAEWVSATAIQGDGFLTTDGLTQLNIGPQDATNNGILGLKGKTSGTATITAPAVAGTSTNPIAFSNVLSVPAGNASQAALQVGSGASSGINVANAGNICLESGGSNVFCNAAAAVSVLTTTGVYGFTTGPGTVGNRTGMSEGGAAIFDFGQGSQGDTTAKLKAAGYISVGTKFATNAGCSEVTTVGGATAGTITTVGSTGCTTIVTLGNTATAPNGWACYAHDLTTSADYNNPRTSSSGTTLTIVTGTIVAADVIEFGCMGY